MAYLGSQIIVAESRCVSCTEAEDRMLDALNSVHLKEVENLVIRAYTTGLLDGLKQRSGHIDTERTH